MVGIPENLLTKKDYYNAVDYAISTGNGSDVMRSRLQNLKLNVKINVLKKSSEGKPAEDQTLDDFEQINDPNCEMARLGFTGAEIDGLIGRLK
jgi:hypothetical protein